MVNDQMLIEITGYQRNRIFLFSRYVQLFNN